MQVISIHHPSAIATALSALAAGELVVYPTETCYGIAADCSSPLAVSRLLAFKGDRHRQVAIAVADRQMAEIYVAINPIADNLYTHFLPGPITVISQSLHKVDSRLESSTGTLGVRIPAYPPTISLIRSFGRPITTTSANTSGKKEPYSLADWQKYTASDRQDMVTLFLDAGRLADRPTSTVVDTTLNDPQILRQGALIIPELGKINLTTTSPAATVQAAANLTRKHLNITSKYPLILALQGDLGVGKTQFVKGVAQTLGIDLNISSPTYTLMKEYPYQDPKYSGVLYHIDTWRLPDPTELESTLHLSSLLKPGNIIAIEWAGKASELLKAYESDIPILVINMKELGENERLITYAFSTPEWS